MTDGHHAHPHPRHLRHFHGGHCGPGQTGGPQRHRLRRQRLSAHVDAARGHGHRAASGVRCCAARSGQSRRLRCRQCDDARQAGDRGNPQSRPDLYLGPAVARGKRAARQMGACRGGNPRQDDDRVDPGVDAGIRRPQSRLSHWRRTQQLQCLGAADGLSFFRGRGGRIRHRVLRQALQVRSLPAAHRHPQQSRIRPRRHFPGRRSDRNAVPSSGAHHSRQRADRRQRLGCGRRKGAGKGRMDRHRVFRPGAVVGFFSR